MQSGMTEYLHTNVNAWQNSRVMTSCSMGIGKTFLVGLTLQWCMSLVLRPPTTATPAAIATLLPRVKAAEISSIIAAITLSST